MQHGKTVKQIPVSTEESQYGQIKRKAENSILAFEGCLYVYLLRHGSSLNTKTLVPFSIRLWFKTRQKMIFCY